MQLRAGGRRSDEGSENQTSRNSNSAEVEGERSFFCWQGVSIYRRGPPCMSRGNHPVRALAAGVCDWLTLD